MCCCWRSLSPFIYSLRARRISVKGKAGAAAGGIPENSWQRRYPFRKYEVCQFHRLYREAIKSFSIFHAYIKNIGSLIIGAVLSLVTVIITFTLDSEWWMKLLAVGIVVYYGYKIFSTPTNIEKVQRKRL